MMQSLYALPRLITITSMMLLMSLSGCLGVIEEIAEETPIDDIVEIPEIITELPTEWDLIPPRVPTSPNLTPFTDCQELETELKSTILEEARIQLLQAVEQGDYYWGGVWAEDDMMMDGDVAESAPAESGGQSRTNSDTRVEGEDFSGTNNQESGVDEADFIKTDGYYIYILNDGTLTILGVPEIGQITFESETEVEGNVREMMLDGDSLVLISTVNGWHLDDSDPLREIIMDEEQYWWRSETLTKFTVVDISNRTAPTVERELYLEGYYMTAREVDGTVRLVNHGWMNLPGIQTWLEYPEGYWYLDWDHPDRLEMRRTAAWQAMEKNEQAVDNLTLSDFVPQIYERQGSEIISHLMTDNGCNDFITSEDSMSRGVTSIMTLDLHSEDFSFEADHLISNWPTIYASGDVMLVVEQAQDWWWYWGNDELDEATNIHAFDISDDGSTTYAGSGRINGTVLDQFCLSEYDGYIRVASTTGQWNRWWMEDPDPMENHVYVLEKDVDADGSPILSEIGHLGGIAQTERIWSARFVDEMAYIVTFEQIDPLWIIDLADPTTPTILGELEVPGVSTYIHPLSDEFLLTIGIGPANEDGTGLDWSKTQLSLFNITNTSSPTRDSILGLSPVLDSTDGWSWSNSEALYEHKAFQYWAPKEMLAVPMNTYRYKYWYDDDGKYQWKYNWVSKLMIINVSEGENMSVHGEVDHSEFYTGSHYYWSDTGIRRSIFMGDFIYAISHAGVTVTNLTTMETVDSLILREAVDYEDQYWEEGETVSSDGTEEERDDGEAESESPDEG